MNESKDKRFPSPYASNEVKNTEEYGRQVFEAIMSSSGGYRSKILEDKKLARQYAKGEQSLDKLLSTLKIEGNNQVINISYNPTRILQKYERVVLDDYTQLKESVGVEATSSLIKIRKEKKKSDLKFNYEYKDLLQGFEQELGLNMTGEEGYPENEDELDLLLTVTPDEREEVLMSTLLTKTLTEDNDLESLKRRFISDIFQVGFGGFHLYVDKYGRRKVDYVPIEDAIYSQSYKENFDDCVYHGRTMVKSVAEIRELFDIKPEQEDKLYSLAKKHSGTLGNGTIALDFKPAWRTSESRPYDDFSVRIYHIFYKSLETIEYVEGVTSTGRTLFELEKNPRSTRRKRAGSSQAQVGYEGWFAGYPNETMVLSWGKAKNMIRDGKDFEKLHSPYVFFMPDNRGEMNSMSAVEAVMPDIDMLDLTMLKIKIEIANHPPSGYAIDHEALMEVDLGGDELQPLDLQNIYKETGVLYYRKVPVEGEGFMTGGSPITPINIDINPRISALVNIYNLHLENIQETLGINPNRAGTADMRRVSNEVAKNQFTVSQTATYYMYRAYLKVAQQLAKKTGISLWTALKHGDPDKGLLYYIGRDNADFIKERESITATQYKYKVDPQLTQEEEARLETLVQQGLSSGELKMADAMLILSLEDISLAEKYIRYFTKKNIEEAKQSSIEQQQAQAQAQAEMGIAVEEAKRETFARNSALQAQEWEIKGKNDKDAKAFELAMKLIEGEQQGRPIPPQYQEFVDLVMENYMLKQLKSYSDTEREIEQEETEMAEQQAQQTIAEAVQSGDMTEEEGMMAMQDLGLA